MLLQVSTLRCRCLRQMLAQLDENTFLSFLKVADSVSDQELTDACLALWAKPEVRLGIDSIRLHFDCMAQMHHVDRLHVQSLHTYLLY